MRADVAAAGVAEVEEADTETAPTTLFGRSAAEGLAGPPAPSITVDFGRALTTPLLFPPARELAALLLPLFGRVFPSSVSSSSGEEGGAATFKLFLERTLSPGRC